MASKKTPPKQRNMVAKHARTFNSAKVFIDRKKEAKKNGEIFAK